MKSLTILGSTGFIGIYTLEVIEQYPDRFQIIALAAHNNLELLFQQCLKYAPVYVVVGTEDLAQRLQQRLCECAVNVEVLFGTDALVFVARLNEIDAVVAAMVDAAGLLPILAAIKAKKQVVLANKEILVMAGSLLIEEAKRSQVHLLPVDSNQSAIFQCLYSRAESGIVNRTLSKVILTTSEGGLHHKPLAQSTVTTPEQISQNPSLHFHSSKGRKKSVNSSTLMNKGFEVIGVCFLFGLSPHQIDVVLHPQSILQVEYSDGSMLVQLASLDRRIPILYALSWPGCIIHSAPSLNLLPVAQLDFQPIDTARYPCLDLAYQTLKIGGTATTILNAANEVAVQAFLEGKILFTDIARLNYQVLEKTHARSAATISDILEDDNLAREIAKEMIIKNYSACSTLYCYDDDA